MSEQPKTSQRPRREEEGGEGNGFARIPDGKSLTGQDVTGALFGDGPRLRSVYAAAISSLPRRVGEMNYSRYSCCCCYVKKGRAVREKE